MPKFHVVMKRETYRDVTVEANGDKEAKREAEKLWDHDELEDDSSSGWFAVTAKEIE